ncbi:23442_t:CDS:2 [Dentiscutata erythropus]|uniref:23442_t:CDS:1 n=1 Tax=Dentiscutata erythropus TaxID=1348616 RepID=A0A9N9FDZ9_9GLOM|nr:23442_t:CDS:2 [Dentiscutata erythropus]
MANKEKIDLFDIMDVDYIPEKPDLYEEISEMLKMKYLSYSPDKEFKEVNGIIFGQHRRIFVSLPVTIKRETKNVHFLVDTSSPTTYICKEAFESYKVTLLNTSYHPVLINNNPISTLLPPVNSHLTDMNILGTEYLSACQAKLIIEFENEYVSLSFGVIGQYQPNPLQHILRTSEFSDFKHICNDVNDIKSAYCELKGIRVILKIVEENKDFFSQNSIERVVNEAILFEKLKIHCKIGSQNNNHPNICQILGVAEENDTFMIVLQHADGGNLQDYLQSKTSDSIFKISWNELIRIAKEIVSGLEWLHFNEVVHCELADYELIVINSNSKNILLHENKAMIYNFSLSAQLSNRDTNSLNDNRNVDKRNNVDIEKVDLNVEDVRETQEQVVWCMLDKTKEFLDFPTECILKIFTDLEDVKDLHSCLFVNKILHTIAAHILWKNPFINNPKWRDSIILAYLNELNKEEQQTLFPLRINFPFAKSHSKYAPCLETLDLHSLHIACLKWLAGAGYFCQCGELRIVQAVVSAIVQMIMRTNKNLKNLKITVAEDEPDCSNVSIFASGQPGISSLHSFNLSLINTPTKKNVFQFLKTLPDLCFSLCEITFDSTEFEIDEETAMLLIRLIRAQKTLNHFTLKCRSVCAEKYIEAMESQKDHLISLTLDRIDFRKVSADSLKIVSQCEKLKHITISTFRGITDKHCYVLSSLLPNLETLYMSANDKTNDHRAVANLIYNWHSKLETDINPDAIRVFATS